MDLNEPSLLPAGYPPLPPFWDDSAEELCDCPPGDHPPPIFVIPPPPPPPSLQPCNPELLDLQFCKLEPFGAHFGGGAGDQSRYASLVPVVGVLGSVIVVGLFVAAFLIWRNKKRMQVLMPFKNNPPPDLPVGNMLSFDPTTGGTRVGGPHGLTPIELLEMKYGGGGGFTTVIQEEHYSRNPPFHQQNDFNPIYEEVSEGKQSVRRFHPELDDNEMPNRSSSSEDEYTEDDMRFTEPSHHLHARSALDIESGGAIFNRLDSGVHGDGFRTERPFHKKKQSPAPSHLPKNTCSSSQKHTHSLERNKDGHISDSFRAKQNYYMSKTMLAPDLSGKDGSSMPIIHSRRASTGHHKNAQNRSSHTRPRTGHSKHRRDDELMHHSSNNPILAPETHPYYACDPELVQQAFYEPSAFQLQKHYQQNFHPDQMQPHRSRRNPPLAGDPIFALVAKTPQQQQQQQSYAMSSPAAALLTTTSAPQQVHSPNLATSAAQMHSFHPRPMYKMGTRPMLPTPKQHHAAENVYSTIDDSVDNEEEEPSVIIPSLNSRTPEQTCAHNHPKGDKSQDSALSGDTTDGSSENYGDLRPTFDHALCT